jgi:hypothetical protein
MFALRKGDTREAAVDLRRATVALHAVGHHLTGIVASSIAVVAARIGDGVAAARLWGVCEPGVELMLSLQPVLRPDHDLDAAEVTAALPPEQFEAERAYGAAMPIEEAEELIESIVSRVTATA